LCHNISEIFSDFDSLSGVCYALLCGQLIGFGHFLRILLRKVFYAAKKWASKHLFIHFYTMKKSISLQKSAFLFKRVILGSFSHLPEIIPQKVNHNSPISPWNRGKSRKCGRNQGPRLIIHEKLEFKISYYSPFKGGFNVE